MEGIQYLIDSKGKKNAVLIDIKLWDEYLEDIQDILISRKRRNETRYSWKNLKKTTKGNNCDS
jgi:hypothetical protein